MEKIENKLLIKDIEIKNSEIDLYKENIINLEKKYLKLKQSNKELKTYNIALKNELEDLSILNNKSNSKINKISKKFKETNNLNTSKITELSTKVSNKDKIIEELNLKIDKLKSKLNTCVSSTKFKSFMENKKKDIDSLTQDLKTKEKLIINFKSNLDCIKLKLNKSTNLLEAKTKEILFLKNLLSKNKKSNNLLTKKIGNDSKQIKKLSTINLKATNKLQILENQISDLKENTKGLDLDKDKYHILINYIKILLENSIKNSRNNSIIIPKYWVYYNFHFKLQINLKNKRFKLKKYVYLIIFLIRLKNFNKNNFLKNFTWEKKFEEFFNSEPGLIFSNENLFFDLIKLSNYEVREIRQFNKV